ncbi:MAG TPA: hypothetical protein VMP68_04225 [Candidatus Eisenbacteria bacterium]|nr:hypothetical protein [Candidatus Eisenbacteria bacterium]
MTEALVAQRWYRYEAKRNGFWDNDNDHFEFTGMRLVMFEYSVAKTTPKGVWLQESINHKRFVLRDARKRYACPTKKEALESFLARKQKHLRIERQRVQEIEESIALAQYKLETLK